MKLKKILSCLTSVVIASSIALCAFGCGNDDQGDGEQNDVDTVVVNLPDGYDLTEATATNTDVYDVPQDYCRTYYEVFVRSFADGNGDGIGDIRGLIDNLDYLNDGDDSTTTDLGVNGIWMMPIHQSTTYHKYDVMDYYSVDSEYGTLDDFDDLIEACDARDIWVQIDLVLNHTSNQHQWFLDAVAEAQFGLEPDDPAAVNMQKYNFAHQSRAPQGGTWRAVPGAPEYWYLSNFDTHMPDVNLSNPAVRDEIENIVDFWLNRGVRSFRLDAVPWAYENSTAYSAENQEFWQWFDEMCAEKGEQVYGERYPGIAQYCYNVGEVWSTTSTVVKFYNTKMSCFNYGFGAAKDNGFGGAANGVISAVGYTTALESIQSQILEISENALLSNFLSGHDNNRSAGYFDTDPVRIKKAASLYLLAPGNPYIYYGEEIGAIGSGKDENKRLHFNWGDSRNVSDPAGSNYTATQKLGSVLDQTNDKDSILTHYRQVIKLRNRFPAIGRGKMTAYALDASGKLKTAAELSGDVRLSELNEYNKTVAAYTLEYNGEKLLIVQNLGDKAAELDISNFAGYQIAGVVKANGGGINLNNGTVAISGGVAAVLKA